MDSRSSPIKLHDVRTASSTSVQSTIVNMPMKVKDFWIEKGFNKRQCNTFIPSNCSIGERDRCVCGHHMLVHPSYVATARSPNPQLWHSNKHTITAPTDAFGQLDFQGTACYATKAQYVRLDYQTAPERILQLLLHQWHLELPKLLISVHGGIANFDLQPKLKRVFNKGLLKAVNTTGAWIITGGTNTGVMRHVGSALAEKSMKKRKKHTVAIGIAPWGVVHKRQDLLGKDKAVSYHAAAHPKNNTAVLNSSHNYFLLADNGTEGKYGADIVLRKKLERYISHQRIHIRGEKPMKGCGVPIVCLVLEGGSNTIRTVLDYLTGEPPVPVVVCDGSGRASDLIAFAHKYTNEEGNLPKMLKEQLISTIKKTFGYNDSSADRLYHELMMCMRKKHLITIFRMGEQCQDIDLPILTALLTSHNTSAPQQLNLALSWDRVDVARSHIFTYGQEWPEGSLQQAMLNALVQNKVDFVQLLLEKGVNMSKFLTIGNLEELYNTKVGSTSTLHMMLRDVRKKKPPNSRVTLLEVGEVLEKLMGGAYRSRYCRRKFRNIYNSQLNSYNKGSSEQLIPEVSVFPFPFSDLMIWAVLLKRQEMAKFMWRREAEALVKAVVACKLYKSLAREAIDEPLVDNAVSEQLYEYAKEFQKLAVDILDHCYKEDDDLANQLLTYELKTFSNQTCISLAHSANMRDLIAHPCCQTLITDMWMGGLRMNKSSTYKVILGILAPFTITTLNFKSKEELQLLPQTVEAYIDELKYDEVASTDSWNDPAMDEIDDNSIIETYPDHVDEVNNIVTWQSVDESEPPSEMESASYKSVELPDNTFPNNNTLMILKDIRKRHQQLKLGQKISEFYKAPVTKFWMHTMAYLIFVCLYTYLILVRLERYFPSPMEIYVMVYIFFHTVEMIREIAVSEPKKFVQKMAIFFTDKWNVMDLISIPGFWIGVGFRLQQDEEYFLIGRVIYCVNIIFWYIRILDLFVVSKHLGPFVVIIGKLVMDMLNFIVILLIVLMSFGVARQGIRNPYKEASWFSLRDVFLEPYFMLYGEVYAPDIDRPYCFEGACLPGQWITPVIMSAYLLVANILLLNLLIAVFNATYQRTSQNSNEIWMFQRYSLTLEYEIKPLFPAPLVIFSFIYLACKWIRRRCKRKPKIQDYGLKLFLSDEDVRKLHDFEEDCVEDYFNTLELQFKSSTEERIKATNERVENILLKMADMNQKENQARLSMHSMEMRLSNLEDLVIQNIEQVQKLNNIPDITYSATFPRTNSSSSFEQTSVDSFPVYSEHGMTVLSSPPLGRSHPQYAARRRSMSGDTAELQHKRLNRQKVMPIVIPPECSGTRPNLLRRRRGKELKPLKTSLSSANRLADGSTTPTVAPDPAVKLVVEQSEIPHSYSAMAGLPSIEETLHGTPMDEHGPALNHSRSVDEAANSAPSELRTYPEHEKLHAVHSLPVPPIARNRNRESESMSHASSPQSMSSIASPRLYSAQSVTGSQLLLNPEHIEIAFTPVKSSIRNEYTSITDSIDTSCVHNSPESSPSASLSPPNRFFFEPNLDTSDVDHFSPSQTSPENQYIQQEIEQLRDAEEHESKVLGSSMRKRIRQISIDDNNSMSDLAQIIYKELDTSSPTYPNDETKEYGNDETKEYANAETKEYANDTLSSTMPANLLNNNCTSLNNEIDLSQCNQF